MSYNIKTDLGKDVIAGNIDPEALNEIKQDLTQLEDAVEILEGQTIKRFNNTIADCNLMTETGTYNRYGQGLTNSPDGADAWNIVVFKLSNEFIMQFALYWNGDHLYARNKWGGTWQAWKKI